MTADSLPPLRDVIGRHGLSARKQLGQNFLLDLNLTGRIARSASPLEGFTALEVGPGPGGLTRALLNEGVDRVIAIERDERCIAALQEVAAAYPGRLEIIRGDATAIDMADTINGPVKIVANLPYNVATPLLLSWLSQDPWPPWFASMTLMFQKEVAERIVAPAGTKAYGRLSVIAQWRTEARKLFDVDRRAFTPQPKVTSSIVQLVPRAELEIECTLESLERVTAAAFGQRRKMLRSSLRNLPVDTGSLISDAGLEPTFRAEQVSVSDFCRMASFLERHEDNR